MSANSPRHTLRCVPIVVPPQAVNDPTIYDSFAGFIDVALANTPQGDPKDTILWTRFENSADISDLSYGDDWDLEGRVPPTLLLIIGYVTGIQVWAIPANGEAYEVLSWRHGSVKVLRILPTPITCNSEAANEPSDQYAHKRPLMAICDNNSSGGTGLQYCSINFISLKCKEHVKTIKFKNPVLDILANRTSVAVTFPEKIAVFDARTLEDRLTITACHPSPGLNPNPISLGPRWMAYAERRLIPSKRSSGGCDYDGVSSYTATVLNAAKSLSKGLRELGETMAAGFSGNAGHGAQVFSPNLSGGTLPGGEKKQPGIITILDIKYPINDASPVSGAPVSANGDDRIIAHFIAHSEAVVAMCFDNSGMLLVTGDKRGHDFHVFRIQPHPGGPTMSAVHHLYVLHRGDTSAKVQDICISLDSRWVAISTLRGTTHVFPITPYGGTAGVRTHGSSHVVNRLSRFHRSAGLSIDSRSSSPISHPDYTLLPSMSAYPNPRTPPFPHPTVVVPLAQLRQPLLQPSNTGSNQVYTKNSTGQRQRLSSQSEDTVQPLRMCTTFARPRAWLLELGMPRDSPSAKLQNRTIESLFIMTAYGALIQYDFDPQPVSSIPKEKVCDDTQIQLDIEAKAQWNLLRNDSSIEIQPPLPLDNILLKRKLTDVLSYNDDRFERGDERDDVWLAQVEIITHAGPHRRLWMGPQFIFKTYNTPSGSSLSTIESESIEIGVGATGNRHTRSNPVNMPSTTSGNKSTVSVLIESSSYSSVEQSPRMNHLYQGQSTESNFHLGSGDNQLREDLADAMLESSGFPLTEAGFLKNSTITTSIKTSLPSTNVTRNPGVTIAKVVNPLGTVTTIIKSDESDDLKMCGDCANDLYVLENCDEALFRPVVTVIEDVKSHKNDDQIKKYDRPEPMGLDLIVPVIEEKTNSILLKKTKNDESKQDQQQQQQQINKFIELSAQNKKKPNKPMISNDKVNTVGKLELPAKKICNTDVPVSKPIAAVKAKSATSKKSSKLEQAPLKPVIDAVKAVIPPVKSLPIDYEVIDSKKCTISEPPSPLPPPPVEVIQTYAPLCEVTDHFSIQESLIKNSNFVLTNTADKYTNEDEKLNFNLTKLDNKSDGLKSSSSSSSKKYFDLSSNSDDDEKQQDIFLDLSKFEVNLNECVFSDPLPPLEPFVDKYEPFHLSDNAAAESPELMNFESPIHDNCNDDDNNDDCCADDKRDDDDDIETTSTEIITVEKSENNSSDDTEESYNESKKDSDKTMMQQQGLTKSSNNDDDEELQPLISAATTSSETTPSFSKAIVDSLPENQKEIKQPSNNNNNNNNKKKSKKKKR